MEKILVLWDSLTAEQRNQVVLIASGAGGAFAFVGACKILNRVRRWLFCKSAAPARQEVFTQREIADGVAFKDYQAASDRAYNAMANEVNYQRQQNSRLTGQLMEIVQPTEESNDDRAAEVAWLRKQNEKLTSELLDALRDEDN